MFAARRTVPRSLAQVVRGNASLASTASESSANASAPAATPATQGRRKRTRPPISLENPSKWNRALPKGVIPAYDLALHLLRKDSENLQAQVSDIRQRIAEKEAQYQALKTKRDALSEGQNGLAEIEEEMELLDHELEKMIEKANIIEVQSEINLPNVRWTVNNAMGMWLQFFHTSFSSI